MRIRRKNDNDEAIINITSLLDVMFILIIFFLATSTLQREEHDIKVNLPSRSEQGSLSSASRTLVINVRKDGSYYLQNAAKMRRRSLATNRPGSPTANARRRTPRRSRSSRAVRIRSTRTTMTASGTARCPVS